MTDYDHLKPRDEYPKIKLDRRWVVENRSAVQTRILDLFEYRGQVSAQIGNSHRIATYGLLVGIIFSLWRTVFLVSVERTIHSELKHANRLLEILIETNSIGFPQDRETGDWMAGFYINNALYRFYALTKIERTRANLTPDTITRIEKIADPSLGFEQEDFFKNFKEKCELALELFDAVFDDLKAAPGK